MKQWILLRLAACLLAAWSLTNLSHAQAASRPPNFVIIFLDDSGWADFHPFGTPAYETPHVDRLAAEGCRFNNFYVPQAICSASRAALLSGCYPGRTKVFGAHGPNGRGLDPQFATIAEVLKKRNYTSAVFGKWHVGDQPDTRPWKRGFDESCGLLYSNDMWEFHPENPKYWGRFPLQFWEKDQVTIERMTPQDQPMLTTAYTEHAVDFIRRHKDRPFFLYVPHSMPHVPLFCSEKFKGKSGAGLYGDVMMEVDWSVGEITKALKTNGLEDNTLVIFTSDNGPWISYGNHAGSTPFREAKATSFDGGVRSACIMKLPGQIKAGSTSTRAFGSIDLLPTLAHLAQADLPTNPIDGKNVWNLITGQPGATNPHAYYPFSTGNRFEGILSGDGRWKLHVPHPYRTLRTPGKDGQAGKYETAKIDYALFDMENDPFESRNLIETRPEIAAQLKAQAEQHQQKFYSPQGKASVIAPGAEVRLLAGGFKFTEGPAVDADGNVFFTDQPNDRIMKWSVEGELSEFKKPAGRSNGLYFDQNGNLLACADEKNQLWSIDPQGRVTVLIEKFGGHLLNGPNDLWIHPTGGLYFTDPFYRRNYWNRGEAEQDGQHVYYLAPNRKDARRVATDLSQPNGIVGTPDGNRLYVADIGAGKTYRYDIQPDGSLTKKKLFVEMGSDGMTIDNEGNIYLTGKGVTVFNSNGERIDQIKIEEGWTANVCFGGKDRRTLFITAMDSLYSIRTRVKGVR